jgi:hypothetical protein
MADTGVIYLCRFAEGEAPVLRFVDSYRRHHAGVGHDLHVILKGFPNGQAAGSARALFGGLRVNTIEIDDSGYDIGSYFAAARVVGNRQLMFLNTFSEILADDWLAHFDKALAMADVGLVGATGSWQSASSGYEAKFFKALRRLSMLPRASGGRQHKLAADSPGAPGGVHDRITPRLALRKLLRATLYPYRLYEFGRHPNPHIRTNAFMMRRDVFLSLRVGTFRRKMDAYRFESGRHSMTRQIRARGLCPVVVDRWGKVYGIPDWKSSSTFWIGAQDNLLVADNQTFGYATGSAERRRILKNYAWDSPWFWDVP